MTDDTIMRTPILCRPFVALLVVLGAVTPIAFADRRSPEQEAAWAEMAAKARASLRDKMKAIEAIALEAWPASETSERVVFGEGDGYKVLGTDGTVRYQEAKPNAPADIEKVWVMANPSGFAYAGDQNGRILVWKRLHWHADKNDWLEIHPNESAFRISETLVERLLYDLGNDLRLPELEGRRGESVNAAIKAESIGQMKFRAKEGNVPFVPSADEIAQAYTELRGICMKWGEPWGLGEELFHIFDLKINMAFTADIPERVAFARQRLKVLSGVVAKVADYRCPPEAGLEAVSAGASEGIAPSN